MHTAANENIKAIINELRDDFFGILADKSHDVM